MIGPILIVIGLFWLWTAWRGKAARMWNAIAGDNFSTDIEKQLNDALNPYIQGNTTGGNSNTAPITGNAQDSGTHMGIDPDGSIIVINKDYGSMTEAEKDAANNYAHTIGNVG